MSLHGFKPGNFQIRGKSDNSTVKFVILSSPPYCDDVMLRNDAHLNQLKMRLDFKSISSVFDDKKSSYSWHTNTMARETGLGAWYLTDEFDVP